MSASIIEHFAPLPDFRVERNKLYPLPEILLLVVCAVLSGAEGWEAIEEFGKAKRVSQQVVESLPCTILNWR